MNGGLQTVHVRVNDAATSKPTPVRIRFVDEHGVYHAPYGRLTTPAGDTGGNLFLGDKVFAYVDGTCEIGLPPGPLTVEIQKGTQYRPVRENLFLQPGKLALRFIIERWSNLQSEGWYSGDIRATDLEPHAALLEAAAEDLAVVNLLAYEDSNDAAALIQRRISGIVGFSGQRPLLEMPGHQVVVNTWNRHPVLGSLALLNSHRIVHPLAFGAPVTSDYWSLADWCDQCHRKAGLVVWTEPERLSASPGVGGEALANLLLARVDAVELDVHAWSPHAPAPVWYDLLNLGYRVALVGASQKRDATTALGCVRTYARLSEGVAFSYKEWIEAVRAGRIFVSSGPMLFLRVEGRDPGAFLELPEAQHELSVEVEARGVQAGNVIELVYNGQLTGSTTATNESCTLQLTLPMPCSGWIAARCHGQNETPGGILAFAHTSPIYVHQSGHPQPMDLAAANRLRLHLENTLSWIERAGNFDHPRQRENLVRTLQNALTALARRAARA